MISVIVPIYKVEEYLRRCIESIINQTYNDLEIILIDDGSPDNCPQICDEYAEKDCRIKVIHKENGGLIAARKTGVKASTGEYVTFVDGDDYISKYMYENVAKAIDAYSPDMVITEFFWSYERKDIPSERTLFKDFYNREDIKKDIFPMMLFTGTYYQFGIYPNCWTKIVKRDILINNIMGVDERVKMGEDAAFTYGCIMDCQSIATVKEPLYYYRILDTSMSKAYDEKLSETWSIAFDSIKKKAEKEKVFLDTQLCYYLLFMMNVLVRNEANSNKKLSQIKAALSSITEKDYIAFLSNVDKSVLPKHTKTLLDFFKLRNLSLISVYSLILRRFI